MFLKVIKSKKTTTSTYIILNIKTWGSNIMDKMCESRRSTHQQKRDYFLSFRWNPTEGGPAELVNVSWAIRETSQKTSFFIYFVLFHSFYSPWRSILLSTDRKDYQVTENVKISNPLWWSFLLLSSAFSAPAR